MGIRKTEFIGLIVVAAIILFAVIFISIDMVNHDVNFTREEVDTEGKVTGTFIFRDNYGISHIQSDSELEAYFALGYAQAKDRLFQIEFIKRAALGRLSELYGKSHIGYDKFIRAFEIDSIAYYQFQNSDERTKRVLSYFTEGINKYIINHRGDFPMEFGLYDAKPEQWQPYVPFIIYNYHALIVSKHLYGDIVFSSLRKKLSIDKLHSILSRSDYEQVNMPFFEEVGTTDSISNSIDSLVELDPSLPLEQQGRGGCNLMLRTVRRDSSLAAVLANDMHSPLLIPQEYYPVHIQHGDRYLAGICLIGTPSFLSGRNNNLAWGRTYIPGDDINYHRLSVDEDKMLFSWDDVPTDSTLNRLELRVDTIRIKGSSDLYYYQRIADGRHLLPDNSIFDINSYNGSTNALRLHSAIMPIWAVRRDANPIGFNLALADSDSLSFDMLNWNNYNQPVSYIGIADTEGGIANIIVGDTITYIPVISDANYSVSHIARLGNKLEMKRDTGRYINSSYHSTLRPSLFYSDDSRKDRLSNLIDESARFTYREADMISHDMFSGYYYELAQKVVEYVEKNTVKLSSRLELSLDLLREWNGITNVDADEYRILFSVLQLIHEKVISRNLDRRVASYLWKHGISDHLILNLITHSNNHSIFETNKKELIQLLVTSLERYKRNTDSKFSFVIPSTFAGIDNDTNILDIAYQIDVAEVRGNIHAVSYFNDRDTVPVGTSYRFISDMGTGRVQISMPGGTSGNLTSDYYDNLAQYWKIGGTININLIPDYSRLRQEVIFR